MIIKIESSSPDVLLLLLLLDEPELEPGPEPPAADDSAANPTAGGLVARNTL